MNHQSQIYTITVYIDRNVTHSASLLGVCLSIGVFLAPLVSASKALRLVNTNDLAALGTGPSFLFVSSEMPYAEFLYVHEIANHTHAVLGSIALIPVL